MALHAEKILVIIAIAVLSSCKGESKKHDTEEVTKLITMFDPSFDESSQLVFLDSGAQQQLGILIRKDFFRNSSTDGIADTFYYKLVALHDSQVAIISDSILKHWDFHWKPEPTSTLDGMSVGFNYLQNSDTFSISQNVSKYDTVAHRLSTATLDCYQSIFQDPIVDGYFEILRSYLDGGMGNGKIMVPFNRLREQKYEGRLRYRPKNQD